MSLPPGPNTIEELRDAYPMESIHRMVHTFYARVHEDPQLHPVFDARISDWDAHLDRMVSFWQSILRSEPAFKPSIRGGPPQLHGQIEELQNAHFDRWLELFGATVREIFPAPAADGILWRAQRIAVALSGHRYPPPMDPADRGEGIAGTSSPHSEEAPSARSRSDTRRL